MKTQIKPLYSILVVSISLAASLPSVAQTQTCEIGGDNYPILSPFVLTGAPTGWIVTQDPGSKVNVRSGAGTEFAVVTQVLPSESVVLISHALSKKCETWFRVEFSTQKVGWVRKDFIRTDRAFGLYD